MAKFREEQWARFRRGIVYLETIATPVLCAEHDEIFVHVEGVTEDDKIMIALGYPWQWSSADCWSFSP